MKAESYTSCEMTKSRTRADGLCARVLHVRDTEPGRAGKVLLTRLASDARCRQGVRRRSDNVRGQARCQQSAGLCCGRRSGSSLIRQRDRARCHRADRSYRLGVRAPKAPGSERKECCRPPPCAAAIRQAAAGCQEILVALKRLSVSRRYVNYIHR